MTASRRVIKFTIGRKRMAESERFARFAQEPVGRCRCEEARVLMAYRQDIFLCRWGKKTWHAS